MEPLRTGQPPCLLVTGKLPAKKFRFLLFSLFLAMILACTLIPGFLRPQKNNPGVQLSGTNNCPWRMLQAFRHIIFIIRPVFPEVTVALLQQAVLYDHTTGNKIFTLSGRFSAANNTNEQEGGYQCIVFRIFSAA